MKKCYLILFLSAMILVSAITCAAEKVDPILLNEPNEAVFGCKNDIFIELTKPVSISKVASGRTAADYFIIIEAEILFLIDGRWNGIDRNSFTLKHTENDGTTTIFPLNYAVSMMANQKVTWHIFSEAYEFTDLHHTNLIFNVPYLLEGWSLLFRPMERGSNAPYCEIEIPLQVH